ncbi:hypothetical protein CLOM_g1501, partial [Closterium sp. NIES-68]
LDSPTQAELKALVPRRRLGFYLFARGGQDKVLGDFLVKDAAKPQKPSLQLQQPLEQQREKRQQEQQQQQQEQGKEHRGGGEGDEEQRVGQMLENEQALAQALGTRQHTAPMPQQVQGETETEATQEEQEIPGKKAKKEEGQRKEGLTEEERKDDQSSKEGEQNRNEGEQNRNEGEQNRNEGEQNRNEGEQNRNEGEQNRNEGEQNINEGERKQEQGDGGGGEHWETGDWELSSGHSKAPETASAQENARRREDAGSPSYRQGSGFDRAAARRSMVQRREDACWSKEERQLYHTANPNPPSAAFLAAVAEHEAMQRECMGMGVKHWEWVRTGNWDKDRPRYGVDRKPCQYIHVPIFPRGLGNRLVNHVNAFILALVTQRAIITTPWSFVVRRLCNPFNSTSWALPWHVHKSFVNSVKNQSVEFKDIVKYHARQGELKEGEAAGAAAAGAGGGGGAEGLLELSRDEVDAVVRNHTVNIHLAGRGMHTFCTDAWAAIDSAVFWSMAIDVYFVPSLYYLPRYAAALNRLFPDHRVLTHTARFLLHPDNQLWAAITRLFHANLAHHSHRVGIQVRSALGIHLPLADRVLSCAADVAQYLPPIGSNQTPTANSTGQTGGSQTQGSVEAEGSVGVFVASLSTQHWLDMQGRYALYGAQDLTPLSFWTLSDQRAEKWTDTQFEYAVMEMWLLSFSDRILISDFSSFGWVALGLAGIDGYSMAVAVLHAFEIDWRKENRPVCVSISPEPCDVLGCSASVSMCKGGHSTESVELEGDQLHNFSTCPGSYLGIRDMRAF